MTRWPVLPSTAALLALLGLLAVFTLSPQEAECFDCPKQGIPCAEDADCYNDDSVFCVLRCEDVGGGEKACLWQD